MRLVWITMLALKDRYHRVEASIPGLSDFAKVAPEKVLEALEILKAPDPWSRTKEHEGRRIREVDGGWEILNGGKYQEKLDELDRMEKNRKNQAAFREREKQKALLMAEDGVTPEPKRRGRPPKAKKDGIYSENQHEAVAERLEERWEAGAAAAETIEAAKRGVKARIEPGEPDPNF